MDKVKRLICKLFNIKTVTVVNNHTSQEENNRIVKEQFEAQMRVLKIMQQKSNSK